MTIPWIQANEDVTGENHPDGDADVANRAPRFITITSGLGADGSWDGGSFPGFLPNFVGSGTPEAVITATVGKFYHDDTNAKLYYKMTGVGDTGWIELPTVATAAATESTFYVGKHGNDANGGRNMSDAFLTFGAAISAAFSGASIVCLDGGTYTEDILIGSDISLFAPHAKLQGTSASGTTALRILSDTWNVIGSVRIIGNHVGRNYGVQFDASEQGSLWVRSVASIGTNVTAVRALSTGKVRIDTLHMNSGQDSRGLDCHNSANRVIDIDIGNLEMSTSDTNTPGPIGVYSSSGGIITGHIGRINEKLGLNVPGNALNSDDVDNKWDLTIDRIQGNGDSTSFDAIRVSDGVVNLRVGTLASAGNAYHIDGGTLRLFTMEISGAITNNGGTLVAKDITDIP